MKCEDSAAVGRCMDKLDSISIFVSRGFHMANILIHRHAQNHLHHHQQYDHNQHDDRLDHYDHYHDHPGHWCDSLAKLGISS